ncbi:MAG: hypothetical protein ACYC9Y_16365 [Candidatus Methylomirabilia bacterium]
MKLTRDIMAVLAGIAASFVLMSAGGWILAQSSETRVMIEMKERSDKGVTPTKAEVDQLFSSLERQGNHMRWVMGPVIVFVAGLIASLIGARGKPILAVLSATPYSVVMTSFAINPEYGVLASYLLIATIGASIPLLVERMKSSNQAL